MRFGNETKKAWALDFSILKERCDVSGFEITDIEASLVLKKVTR